MHRLFYLSISEYCRLVPRLVPPSLLPYWLDFPLLFPGSLLFINTRLLCGKLQLLQAKANKLISSNFLGIFFVKTPRSFLLEISLALMRILMIFYYFWGSFVEKKSELGFLTVFLFLIWVILNSIFIVLYFYILNLVFINE